MDAEKIAQLETLLGRELSIPEKERLRRIKDTLQIADNDALWDIIVAMEYQRKYYEELPEKISLVAANISNRLSEAVVKEVAIAQSQLAGSMVEQARKLSLKIHVHSWLIWGVSVLILLLLCGSFLVWIGYCLGSGQAQPVVSLLHMPTGIVIGTLSLGCGIFCGGLAAKDYSEYNVAWRKRLLVALGYLLPGGGVICIVFL